MLRVRCSALPIVGTVLDTVSSYFQFTYIIKLLCNAPLDQVFDSYFSFLVENSMNSR